jgi:hypothetical protein
MKTIKKIIIAADPDRVYRTAVNFLDWPIMLPHYRWVHHIGGKGSWRIYDMSAWRLFLPMRWASLAHIEPDGRRIYFRHIGGLTKGMEVVWYVRPYGRESEVTIAHELLRPKMPIARSAIGRFTVNKIFVEPITDQTLRYMKHWVEAKGR